MNDQSVTVRKVTVSLPDDLVAYADERAEKMNTSRSQVISLALTRIKSMEEEQLAIEGYQFYSKEAEEFAAASFQAATEAIKASEDNSDAN
jgi:metal-responsive CopG/Arc/MetJ family transcriptional regulator